MNKKHIILISVIVVVVLIAFIVAIFQSLSVSRDTPEDFTAAPIVDNNLTAGEILSWLDTSMRDERGVYNTFYNCNFGEDGEPVCDNGNSSNRTGMAVMWANYAYFQATKDDKAMDRLARDIAIYANRDLVNIIQTDDLSCFYMEPIVHSEHPAVDREVARKICLDTEYEISLTGDNHYNFTIDTLYAHRDNANRLIASITGETPLTAPTLAGLTAPDTASAEYSVIVDKFWATWATEHAAKYLLNEEPDTLIDAYFFYAGALAEYSKSAADRSNINRSCELMLASSQMCKLVDNKSDTSCLVTGWLDKKIEEMSIADSSPELEAIAKCALADTPNRDRYTSFLTDYYNSPENNYYQFDQVRLLNEYGGLSKNVVTNALFVGLSAGR